MSPHGPSGTETRHHPEARTVGVDFGTLSGRAVVVRASNGAELGASVHAYRHVVIEDRPPSTGTALHPDRALRTLALGTVDPPRRLPDRHRTRKHGPDASCGNPASA
ncbi:hypothetical protein ACH4Q7_27825 [Streptomyces roseolus]|uniref:hypothetical protein n=1 Tax=Streptomyces roseolus TaxID=67358 RepID=UPI0037AE5C97